METDGMYQAITRTPELHNRNKKVPTLLIGFLSSFALLGIFPGLANAQQFEPINPLFFSMEVGGKAPLPQLITVTSTSSVIEFSASASINSGGSWLAVSGGFVNTPWSPMVSVNQAVAMTLPAGTYTGSLRI